LISAEGQDAIDLLYSANELKGLINLNKSLNQKTELFMQSLIKGDTENLKTFFSGDTITNTIELWKKSINQLGSLKSYRILGTSALNQKGSQSFIKMQFANSSGTYKIT